jgi:hypothetical protein
LTTSSSLLSKNQVRSTISLIRFRASSGEAFMIASCRTARPDKRDYLVLHAKRPGSDDNADDNVPHH